MADDERTLHERIQQALKIGVFGSDADHCSDRARELAYAVGQAIAQSGNVFYTGAGFGVAGLVKVCGLGVQNSTANC